MTFEKWSKDLLCKELKAEGSVYYIKKPAMRQGWYCVTPTGFFLHVEAEKIRFGFFRIEYEIMPLVGEIHEPPSGLESMWPVGMGNKTDAARPYMYKFGLDPLNHECNHLRTKEIAQPKTYESTAVVIRDFLNPTFASLNSYADYAKATIEVELYRREHNELKRAALAQQLFDCGLEVGVDREGHCPHYYPQDYPWYAKQTTAMPYVYAALGKYKAAIAHIRSSRELLLRSLDESNGMGFYEGRMDEYFQKKETLEQEDLELETAMLSNDAERVREILQKNYQKNRELVRKMLGIELPESCAALT